MNRTPDLSPGLLQFIHDLRSPLTAIRACAEMMEREHRRDYLPQILRNVARAERLIAALAGGEAPPALGEVSLKSLVEEILAEICVEGQVRCVFSCDGEVRGAWETDRVRQALLNLIDNAIKYARPESVVLLGLTREGSLAVFTTQNERLLPAETLDERQLFTPRYRGETARSLGIQGWGLGLSIVHDVAKAHGGAVSCEDLGQDGIRFTLRLPTGGDG